MTGPSGAGTGGAPRQSWGPERVTCPSCGLTNDPGARVCLNCGLPIASAADPLRGVTPGRLEIPGVRNSGISATVGLVAVVTVLIVAGVLIVGGDSVLRRGGLIFGGGSDPSPAPGASTGPGRAPRETAASSAPPAQVGTVTDFSCESVQIRDPERSRWLLDDVEVGVGDGFEQVRVRLQQRSGRVREAGTVRTSWLTPEDAVARFQIPRPAGSRALVMTFVGDVSLETDRTLDASAIEAQGLDYLRSVQVTTDPEGHTMAVVGMTTDGCARLSSPKWRKKGADRNADVLLDVQTR